VRSDGATRAILPYYRGMGDDSDNAIIKVDAKAAEKVVDRTADGIGGLFGPWQRRRMARAQAEAVEIEAHGEARAGWVKAEAEIAIEDLRRRAEQRRIEENVWHQRNIEQITAQARLLLTDGADETKVHDDWFANFYEKTRNVSDAEMQSVWARVLASEVNEPGAFSRRTVNFLADLDRADCEMFTSLCGYLCGIHGGHAEALIYNMEDPIYASGARFGALIHLESIGLIQFSSAMSSYTLEGLPKQLTIDYFDTRMTLELERDENEFGIGRAMLTRVGRELALIAGGKPVPGFVEYLGRVWAGQLRSIAPILPQVG
jgi:hypothetical protein